MPGDLWNGIMHVRPYHPWHGGNNAAFNAQDGLVLDLKDNLDKGIHAAADDFIAALTSQDLPMFVRIAVVPGHEARPTHQGRALSRVAARMAATPFRQTVFYDMSDALLRHTTIDKLATGGERHEQVHLNSIRVAVTVAAGQTYVVIDDVTTSGSSLLACRRLLLEAGAARVGLLALGLTT